MRRFLRVLLVLALPLVASAHAAAGQAPVEWSLPPVPRPAPAYLTDEPPQPTRDHFSAPAAHALGRRRPPWLLPVAGAAVGAVAMTGLALYDCSRNTDCIMHPLAPAAGGAVLGGAVGLAVELVLRVAKR